MPGVKIRVLSVDDHPLLRQGIGAVVNSAVDMGMVAQAATGREAVRIFRGRAANERASVEGSERSWLGVRDDFRNWLLTAV